MTSYRDEPTVPRAVLLARRRRLQNKPSTRSVAASGTGASQAVPTRPATKPTTKVSTVDLECLMYPAAMGPDDQLDRLGYGEIVEEMRRTPDGVPTIRTILRTRSGSLRISGRGGGSSYLRSPSEPPKTRSETEAPSRTESGGHAVEHVGSQSAAESEEAAAESEEAALTRAWATLAEQRFQREYAIPRPGSPEELKSVGARIGGELAGDWDSALQVIGEALNHGFSLPRAEEQLKRLVDDVLSTIERAYKTIDRFKPATAGDLSRAIETLRINYLALIVLVRQAHRSAELRAHLAPLVERVSPIPLADPDDLEAYFAKHEQKLSKELAKAASLFRMVEAVRNRDKKLPRRPPRAPAHRVRAGLRAFLLLALFPPRSAPSKGDVAPAQRRALAHLLERAGDLYVLASGVQPTDDWDCGWPPARLFRGANALVHTLHWASGQLLGERGANLESLEFRDQTVETWVPAGSQVKALLKSLGSVPQAKDLLGALGLIAMPERHLGTKKADTWLDFMHDARGPFGETTGLYCYLAITSAVATAALSRYLERRLSGKPLTDEVATALSKSAEQSLGAMRALRFASSQGLRGLPFAQFCMYNEMYVHSLLLSLELDELARGRFVELVSRPVLGERNGGLLEAVQYILSCRSTNDLFQQRYRSNELDEGELFAAGQCIRTLAVLSRALTSGQLSVGEDGRDALQREIGAAITTSARALLEGQNASGGFATFERTDREKHGHLGAVEGPGAQDNYLYDAAAADTTAWVIEGLCQVRTSARQIAYVALRPAERARIDAAIDAAVGWLRRDFDPRSGWWARYGGGYVMGTACALRALAAAAVSSADPIVTRSVALLQRAQNQNGGWGQSPDADDPTFNDDPTPVGMRGASDPELTACVLMALLDSGVSPDDASISKAKRYLIAAERPQGRTGGWVASGPQHSFMQGWIYTDQAHTDLRPVQALLTWAAKRAQAAPRA